MTTYIVGGNRNHADKVPSTEIACCECGRKVHFTEVSLSQAANKPSAKFICAGCALLKPDCLRQLLQAIARGMTPEQKAEMRLAGYTDEYIDKLESDVQRKAGLR